MRMTDLIYKKKHRKELNKEEIQFFVNGLMDQSIPDYQVSALMMAIYFNSMTENEIYDLTEAMKNSGDTIDLSAIQGCVVDKHSTGGVGDKTTLIITPMVAALGAKVAKLSGRALGHTGGTIDKLESIQGFKTELSNETFFDIVNRVGAAVVGQTANLAPADKKLYALRDVTETVDSIPLIASSIMSKKLASGSDAILLDVKLGSGAFMKTPKEAEELAKTMVQIGTKDGKNVAALITDMDTPLGRSIGNLLEVEEAVMTLKGHGPSDLTELCIELAANMLTLSDIGPIEETRKMARKSLEDQTAFEKFREMVQAQGGDFEPFIHISDFSNKAATEEVLADRSGTIESMDAEQCGYASNLLGAGRKVKEDVIDLDAGIVLHVKTGDRVEAGQTMATLYSSDPEKIPESKKVFLDAIEIGEDEVAKKPLIYARVTKDGVEYF